MATFSENLSFILLIWKVEVSFWRISWFSWIQSCGRVMSDRPTGWVKLGPVTVCADINVFGRFHLFQILFQKLFEYGKPTTVSKQYGVARQNWPDVLKPTCQQKLFHFVTQAGMVSTRPRAIETTSSRRCRTRSMKSSESCSWRHMTKRNGMRMISRSWERLR